MLKIGILEDEPEQVQTMKDFLERFREENPDFEFVLEVRDRGFKLLDGYSRDYDLLFLDIQVPDTLGIDVARRIREVDSEVMIVFVTNLTQYAIEGYSVNAFDYILKPVNYFTFARKLERALRLLSHRGSSLTLDLKTKEGGRRVSADSITYIEVSAHDLFVHTGGEVIRQWGTLSKFEELLKDAHFARCGAGYLVNLKYVRGVEREQVLVGDDRVPLSRAKRKEFLGLLAQYKGGTM